jgi:hypothetical protein
MVHPVPAKRVVIHFVLSRDRLDARASGQKQLSALALDKATNRAPPIGRTAGRHVSNSSGAPKGPPRVPVAPGEFPRQGR